MPDQPYWDEIDEGFEIPRLVRKVTTQQLVMYAAASGDFNQIHYDETFAKSTGLKDVVVHGALKAALLGQMLHDWVGEAGRIKRFGCQYRGMDFPGQELVCRGVVTKKYEDGNERLLDLDIWVEAGAADDDGRPKTPAGQTTTPGSATVVLPVRS
jgi:acyl dehydratase